jgi:5-methyltetrahydrofolate--homocysteine methyltransferase
MNTLELIALILERGEHREVGRLVAEAIDHGLGPEEILDRGLLKGMAVVGERFRRHDIFLPDVLLAARAMYAGLDLLKPLLAAARVPTRGAVVLGTVAGDQHDIGKNLVGIMLEGAGYEIIDLGVDVAPERFVDAAVTHHAPVIGMSALLTTTMPAMRRTIDLVRQRNLPIKTIVGGAPVTSELAQAIGADSCGADAASAVTRVAELIEASRC